MTRPKRGKGGNDGETPTPGDAPRVGGDRPKESRAGDTRARGSRSQKAAAKAPAPSADPAAAKKPPLEKRDAAEKKQAPVSTTDAPSKAAPAPRSSERASKPPLSNGKSTPPLANGSAERHALSPAESRVDEGATVAPPRRARAAKDERSVSFDLEEGDEQIFGDGLAARPVEGVDSQRLDGDDPASSEAQAASRLARGSAGDRLREAAAFGSAQSLLSTDYYFRQYGARGMRSLLADVDDFGFDPHVDEKVRPILEAVCKRYFRVEVIGSEHIPQNGRALLVANRSGALPWDGLVLRTALRARRPELAALRWLSEDSVIHYPFMGVFMNRLGAVRACPENAERLLSQNRLVAVFPEGAQGSRKLFRDRYRLQRFGRGGYVKLALKFDTPILPTAIIGGEETNPVLGQSRVLARFFGRETFPITPTFPWLGPAGLLPAPVRWRIVIGEPIDLSAHGSAAADDALVVHRLNEQIRSSLQALVDHAKRTRGSALFG